MARRDAPNSYFAWYNDDDRLAVVVKQGSSDSDKGTTAGEYDTYLGGGNLSGTISTISTDGSTATATCSAVHNLETGDTVTISSTGSYDASYSITVTSTTVFTFASSALGATADNISDITVSGGTSTVTTAAAHGISVDDSVYIDASNNTYDATVTVASVADTTHFTYTTSEGDVSGLTGNVYNTGTFTTPFVNNGIRMTVHSKYETVTALTDDLEDNCGLDSTMHSYVLDYVKSRMLEDMGQVEQSQYFRTKYENGVAKKATRKSGVRVLLVPNL